MHISEVLQLFEKIKQMLIELRSIMTDEVSDTYRVRVLQCMQRWNLTPDQSFDLLTSTQVMDLPIS